MVRSYKILIVDDEFEIREGLRSFYWERFHFEVTGCVANGKQALDMMHREAADVVVTDIKMPVMDGIELSHQLRVLYPQVKIIILSGYKEFNLARSALQAGVTEYLLKPVNLKELGQTMHHVKSLLDAEKQSSELLQSYELQLAESLPAARDHFFRSLIDGTLPEYHEAKEKMSLLEIEMNASSFCCASIKLIPIDDHERSTPGANRIETMCKLLEQQQEEDQHHSYVLVRNRREIAVFFNINAEAADARRAASLVLKRVECAFEAETGWHSVIGLGEVYRNLLSFPDSYQQAKKMMDRCFFMERYGLFVWHESAGGSSGLKEYPFQTESKLLDAVLEGAPEGSLQQLHLFWEGCDLGLEHAEPATIRKYIVPLLTMLERRLNLHGTSLEKLAPLQASLTDFIDPFRTLSQLKAALERLIVEVARQIKKMNDDVQTTSHTAVQQVKKYIEEHYRDKITLNQMADLVYLNPSYFSMQFKKETGVNFVDYLKFYRMEKAKELLRRIDLKVYEIGGLVGYQDRKYFATTFKSYAKVTPLEYRQSFITY
ncbi:response regulator [Gorillibacterium sp. sgz5001074]|uniref:response regulator n=1 Tax=Gorillibacterium sp. sgz5001074 TaxID=3446695 RepID=UPI003F678D92